MAIRVVQTAKQKKEESLRANVVMTKYGFVYDQRKLNIGKEKGKNDEKVF